MKKLLLFLISTFTIVFITTGCVNKIYSAFVDERNVKTIAKDTSIELEIQSKLTQKKSKDLLALSVTSYEGNVFLVGEYETTSQKQRFLDSAKKVEGVKSVKSYFIKENKNHPCDTAKDIKLTTKVKTKLIGDENIWSTNVHVSTMQCQVVLWGTVGKKDEITKSINHAKSVKGVRSVKSFLKSKK